MESLPQCLNSPKRFTPINPSSKQALSWTGLLCALFWSDDRVLFALEFMRFKYVVYV